MSKDWYMAAHEKLAEEYLEENPEATDEEAFDKTADAAYDRMRDNLADMADRLRQRAKDEGH